VELVVVWSVEVSPNTQAKPVAVAPGVSPETAAVNELGVPTVTLDTARTTFKAVTPPTVANVVDSEPADAVTTTLPLLVTIVCADPVASVVAELGATVPLSTANVTRTFETGPPWAFKTFAKTSSWESARVLAIN
jgi:hypothetical protein